MNEQCDIKKLINVEVKGDAIVIKPIKQSQRADWEAQFDLANTGNENDLMGGFSNEFDYSEWTW